MIDNDADLTAIATDVSDTALRRPAVRLRNAERRLHASSLLSALDLERGNLWLFLPSKELHENGNIILPKADAVLRGAGCQPVVPLGSTIKVQKLWDDENARLKRLFAAAVATMVRRSLQEMFSAIPLNPSTFLIPSAGLKIELDSSNIEPSEVTSQICTVKIDLYRDGLVWITTDNKPCSGVKQVSSLLRDQSKDHGDLECDVWLASLGHLARYMGPEIAEQSNPLSSPATATTKRQFSQTEDPLDWKKISDWKRNVCDWLVVLGFDREHLLRENWIKVRVYVRAATDESKESITGALNYQDHYHLEQIVWPSFLCVTRETITQDLHADISDREVLADPLKWAQDWYNESSSRLDAIGKRKAARIAKQLQQDQAKNREPAGDEDIGDTFSVFPRTNHDNAAVSGIYPTPPDGALSQATPGPPFEPSIDTPDDTEIRPNRERRDTVGSQDQSMAMFEDGQESSNAVTGAFDEDLFEDSGGADFAAGGIADEPDWDFFNEPDESPVQAADISMKDASDVVFAQNEGGQIEAEDSRIRDTHDAKQHELEVIADTDSVDGQRSSKSQYQSEFLQEASDQQKSIQGHGITLPAAVGDYSDVANNNTQTALKTRVVLEGEKNVIADQPFGSYKRVPSERLGITLDDKYGASGRFYFEMKKDRDMSEPADHQWKDTSQSSPLGLGPLDSQLQNPAQLRYSSSKYASDPRSGLNRSDSLQSSRSSGFASDSVESYPIVEAAAGDGLEAGEDEHQKADQTDMEIDDLNSEQVMSESFDLLEQLQNAVEEWPIGDILGSSGSTGDMDDSISEEECLKIAQIAIDQETQSSFGDVLSSGFAKRLGNPTQSVLERVKQKAFGLSNLSMSDLAAIPEPTIKKVQSSRIQVKRDNESLQALTSILPFWESFSLEPANGEKNVLALCIYPDEIASFEAADSFLERMELAYDNGHFGSHRRSSAPPIYSGLVPWKCRNDSKMQNLARTCEAVGDALPSGVKAGTTFVIYIINPFPAHRMETKFGVCAGFLRLFESYRKSRSSSSLQDVDITLQIIPLPFVQSSDTVAIAPQGVYTRLAIEVYNRCPPSKRTHDFAACGSAVMLAPNNSKHLLFSLSDTAESPLKSEEKLLHVAYCQTPDQRWVVAAWSDLDGRLALTMSYCLRYQNHMACRQLSEIIEEIWETSLDIVRASENTRKHRWRLVVVKRCPIDIVELNKWNVLAQGQVAEDIPNLSHLAVTHVTMATRPALKLKAGTVNASTSMQSATVGSQSVSQQSNVATVSTPVSTPTSSQPVLSPEHLMFSAPTPASNSASLANAPTPPSAEHGFDMDADSILINPADESEYLLLPPIRSLNNSHSVLEHRPAKRSAYLFQHTSSSLNSNPTHSSHQSWLGVSGVDVNLIQRTLPHKRRGRNGKEEEVSDETVLEELLAQYRGLITLAKTRGMVPDPEREGLLLPWHLETAARGCKILCAFP